jgi:hypothetical protein
MLSWNETLTNVGRSWPASCKSYGDFSWVLWFQWTKPRWWKNALQQQVLPMPSLDFLRILFFLLIFKSFSFFLCPIFFRFSYLGNMSSTYWFILSILSLSQIFSPSSIPSLLPFAIAFKNSALEKTARADAPSAALMAFLLYSISSLSFSLTLFLFLYPSLADCPRSGLSMFSF